MHVGRQHARRRRGNQHGSLHREPVATAIVSLELGAEHRRKAFLKVADRVATPVLLQVFHHFKTRPEGRSLRAFFPKGNVAKVQVRPGQSLWTLAEAYDPNADTRQVIQEILQLNSLSTDQVQPGQVLWMPRD